MARTTKNNSSGGNMFRCSFPGCTHVGQVITKAHCRTAHGMEKIAIEDEYGEPTLVTVDTNKRKANMQLPGINTHVNTVATRLGSEK